MVTENSDPQPDVNPWPVLKEKASRRQLEFRPDVAYGIADAAAATIGHVRSLQLDARALAKKKPLSNLPSGTELSNVFTDRAAALDDIMDTHLGILQDLVDTMIAAGKAYDRVDLDNAGSVSAAGLTGTDYQGKLDEITVPQAPIRVRPYDDVIPDHSEPNGCAPSEMSKELRVLADRETVPIHPEPPAQSWRTLHELRVHIEYNMVVAGMADWAYRCNRLGEDLDMAFADLGDKAITHAADWEGDAKEVAASAIQKYVTSTKPLRAAMNLMAENADLTRQYLAWTHAGMPVEPENPHDQSVLEDYDGASGNTVADKLPEYQQRFAERYLANLAMTAEYVPVFPRPEASFSGLPAQEIKGRLGDVGGRNSIIRDGLRSGLDDLLSRGPLDLSGDITLPQPETDQPQHDSEDEPDQDQPQGQGEDDPQPDDPQPDDPRHSGQSGLDGMSSVSQGLPQLFSAAQQAAAQRSLEPAMSSTPPSEVDKEKPPMPTNKSAGLPKSGLPKLGGSPFGPALPKELTQPQASKMFPRAGLPTGRDGSPARATAPAPVAGAPGAPGMSGAPARGAQSDEKHQTSPALKSRENLDDAIGDPMIVGRPVLDI
ncbi:MULTISPECIES: hypothetical protein [unclassified Nocardia]|uniref:hypothetical protein n=1 Tax=unclassified Nocardia TaxID=2637762 RepID=UPI001CE40A73|nr:MULTISPECIES: hypothetical protein [unclassified Nocardia]